MLELQENVVDKVINQGGLPVNSCLLEMLLFLADRDRLVIFFNFSNIHLDLYSILYFNECIHAIHLKTRT